MRSQDEIVGKLLAISKEVQLFDFRKDTLLVRLDREHAETLKGVLFKEDADFSDWKLKEPTDKIVLQEMKDYMDMAWEKATGHRGLSAIRSIQRLEAWCWLLGEDELVELLADGPFQQYGMPGLASVSNRFEWDIPLDEKAQRMIAGLPCVPGCEEGCGK